MHVNGSNRGILELDLATVMGNDEEKSALGMVKSLDLSKNELKVVSNMQPLTALVSLDVSRNRISKLVGLPLGLTKLHVSHNHLVNIEGIAALPFLTDLDISHNRIVSLGGLPRVSPLSVLNLSNNRLPSLSGLEVLAKLQILHVDQNFVCTPDDIKQLRYTSTLKAVSFRGCPLTELADYAAIVKGIAPSVVTLDGTSIRTHMGNNGSQQQQHSHNISGGGGSGGSKTQQRRGSSGSAATTGLNQSATGGGAAVASPMKFLRDVDGSVPAAPNHPPPPVPGEPQTGVYNVSNADPQHQHQDLSFQGVAGKAENRRLDLTEQLRKVERDHNDTVLLLQQERRECSMIHNKNRKLEQQLSEARRVMADELHQVSELREANHRLEEEVRMQKTRADKSARDYKYAQQKLRAEQRKRADEVEKLSVNHEVSISAMQQQIRTNVDTTRRMAKEDQATARETEALKRKVAALQSTNRSLVVEVSRLESELSVQRSRSISRSPSSHHRGQQIQQEEEEDRYDGRGGTDHGNEGVAPHHHSGGRHIVDYYHDEGQDLGEYYDENPADAALSRSISRNEVTARGSGGGVGSKAQSQHRRRDQQVAEEDDVEEDFGDEQGDAQYFDNKSPFHHSGRGPASHSRQPNRDDEEEFSSFENDPRHPGDRSYDQQKAGEDNDNHYEEEEEGVEIRSKNPFDKEGRQLVTTHRPAPHHVDASLGGSQFAQQLKSWLLSEIKADAHISEATSPTVSTTRPHHSDDGDDHGSFQPVPQYQSTVRRSASASTASASAGGGLAAPVPAEPLAEPTTQTYHSATLGTRKPRGYRQELEEAEGSRRELSPTRRVVESRSSSNDGAGVGGVYRSQEQVESAMSLLPTMMGTGVGGVPVRLVERTIEGDDSGTTPPRRRY